MKYLSTIFLLALLHSASGQYDQRIRNLSDSVITLNGHIAFLLRDCTETHRRLDSLIGEMKNIQHLGSSLPNPAPFFLLDSESLRHIMRAQENIIADGHNLILTGTIYNDQLAARGDNAMGRKFDTVLVIRTLSNELPSNTWRHVDHTLYQARCYAVYDPSGTEDPVFLDHNKKPFPSYMRVWPTQ